MDKPTLTLREPRLDDEESFKRVYLEFARETPPWQFAFHFDPELPFTDYLKKLSLWEQGEDLDGFVPNSFLVGVVENEVVGRLSLRHHLNDFLFKEGGHIGYGVSPRFRGQGYASEMLQQSLPLCAELGIERALLLCDVDNIASRRVIEKSGGLYESTTNDPLSPVQKHRFWIPIQ